MRMPDELLTARLRLRRWRPADAEPLAAMNRDPEVTRFLRPLDEAAIAAYPSRLAEQWERHGFGLYALEARDGGDAGAFVGFAGLSHPTYLPELAHRPEMAWRLARRHWGCGLATEAALAVRDAALAAADAPARLISIIHPDNRMSQRIAVKLGMHVTATARHPGLDRLVEVWETPARAAPAYPARSST